MSNDAEDAPGGSSGRSRRGLAWAVSLAGAALLAALSQRIMPLWPETMPSFRPLPAVFAGTAFVAYMAARTHRLAVVLDPVARAEGLARVPRRILWGSGLVSFWVLLVLPLRLGELSRPVIFDRCKVGTIRFAEVLSATAVERVADGLTLCAVLAAGVAGVSMDPAAASATGRTVISFAVLFGAGVVGLVWVAARPSSAGAVAARPFAVLGRADLAARAAAVAHRMAATIEVLADRRVAARFVAWTAAYWGLAVLYPWAVAHAVGYPLSAGGAAVVVGAIGLAIQLPGGPAQLGSFQFGAAVALAAVGDATSDPAVAFVAALYALQIVGTAAAAVAGLVILSWGRRAHGASAPA